MARVATRRTLLTPKAVDGEWSPIDLLSLVSWYDASDPATLFTDAGTTQVSSDGDAVYRWNDKRGNGQYHQQTTLGNRPDYKTNIQNGLSTVEFIQTNSDYLVGDGTLGAAFSGEDKPISIVTVVSADNINRFTDLINIGNSGSATQIMEFAIDSRSGQQKVYFQKRDDSSTLVAASSADTIDGSFAIYAVIHSGTSVSIYKNGGAPLVNAAAVNNGTITTNTSWIGSRSTAEYYDGDIGEIVICNSALSTSDTNTLCSFLADKWDLSWTNIS
jgi:hypothetical protein